MPICHIVQSGEAALELSVGEVCLNSIKKEFGKFLRPKSIQVASCDIAGANNLAMAARKVFKAQHVSVSQLSFMVCLA